MERGFSRVQRVFAGWGACSGLGEAIIRENPGWHWPSGRGFGSPTCANPLHSRQSAFHCAIMPTMLTYKPDAHAPNPLLSSIGAQRKRGLCRAWGLHIEDRLREPVPHPKGREGGRSRSAGGEFNARRRQLWHALKGDKSQLHPEQTTCGKASRYANNT